MKHSVMNKTRKAAENFQRACAKIGHSFNRTYREKRYCTRETYSEGTAPGFGRLRDKLFRVKVWTFYYSDGTTEELKQITPA